MLSMGFGNCMLIVMLLFVDEFEFHCHPFINHCNLVSVNDMLCLLNSLLLFFIFSSNVTAFDCLMKINSLPQYQSLGFGAGFVSSLSMML